MKYMGWSFRQLAECPIQYVEEILAIVKEEADAMERIRLGLL